MKINNKEFGEWTADDLQVLLSNDAYRENNFIDYKVNFAPLIDKSNKKEKQAEFRNDVCSFANADGGYIFYGIGETSGVASILAGISIPNIDRFELDRRNELQAIRPTVPDVAFSFISLQDDKYIVVLHIQRGLYKPYITEEPEGQFHFYIRHGNKKQAMYHCPPAKAIGAIGMREDTMPDIVILVEDDMAKALFMELKRKYFSYYPEQAYLDIRVLEIGGYKNVINFYVEANNYVFYDNVFVTAFMDKDVETDVIPYPQYGNQEDIQRYHDHSRFLKFLPYTPEVLLVKTYIERKQQFLQSLRAEYSNQQVDYSIAEQLDFTAYEAALPNFSNQTQYNSKIEERGSFRKKCKQVAEKIALELSQQLNITVKEVYRYSYKFAVENIPENELNVRALLAQTMKRVR